MDDYASILAYADLQRRLADDSIVAEWYAGYRRGLQRAHHGDAISTKTEHALFVSLADSFDKHRAALGAGYRAGFAGEPCVYPVGTSRG